MEPNTSGSPAKKRGLGRGLDALLGGARLEGVPERLRMLPVNRLAPSAFQPRKDIDSGKLQELADSISAQGIVQPIVVRELGEGERFEIIAGERRWRAAQLAGLSELPVLVRRVSDQSALAIALIENIQREDLNALEEAEALKRLLDEYHLTHQQLADAVGKSRVTVTNLLRLNELQPEVKRLLASGHIEMGHARTLLGLDGVLQVFHGHSREIGRIRSPERGGGGGCAAMPPHAVRKDPIHCVPRHLGLGHCRDVGRYQPRSPRPDNDQVTVELARFGPANGH